MIWRSWFLFRRGKRRTKELDFFEYALERHLPRLASDLENGTYRHGAYRQFTISDNKRREIRVADIRDRIVHRLLYEYLNAIYDKTFIFDVWSCRKGKGLIGAINRTEECLWRYPRGFVWRADIRKFFDHIDHKILKEILAFRIADIQARTILFEVIDSYAIPGIDQVSGTVRKRGIPIGNLTSQIFANIYLNEFDRFVKHTVKPLAYLRYGDDFFIIADTLADTTILRDVLSVFLMDRLRLSLHQKNDILIPVKRGLKFLGVEIFPDGRRLKKRNWKRAQERVGLQNLASYSGLVRQHSTARRVRKFEWGIFEKMESYDI